MIEQHYIKPQGASPIEIKPYGFTRSELRLLWASIIVCAFGVGFYIITL